MHSEDPAIRTEGLSRTFGRVRALDGLTLTVPRGSIFGFLGPNGAGKSTTIRLLLGLLAPTSGRATVLGFDTRTEADEIRERAGALLEHPGLYERLSAEDNLDFYGRVWRLPQVARRARVEELLRGLGLWERRRDLVGVWSAGMKRKLAVARVLVHRPPLIFLDEPSAGLDPVSAAALHEDITGLVARDGATVFLTTHAMVEAEQLCQFVAIIANGQLLAVDTPAGLRARVGGPRLEVVGRGLTDAVLARLRMCPEVASAECHNGKLEIGKLEIGLRGDAPAAPLVHLLVDAGVEVEEVRKGTASLEEAYLQLMQAAA